MQRRLFLALLPDYINENNVVMKNELYNKFADISGNLSVSSFYQLISLAKLNSVLTIHEHGKSYNFHRKAFEEFVQRHKFYLKPILEMDKERLENELPVSYKALVRGEKWALTIKELLN